MVTLFISFSAFIALLPVTFIVTAPMGDPIELASFSWKTNNITSITYLDLDGRPASMLSTDAMAYNSTDIVVKGQRMKNCWGFETFPVYSGYSRTTKGEIE